MTTKLLNWAIVAALAVGLAAPATAGQKVKTKSNIKNDRAAGQLGGGCSISSGADSTTIRFQLSDLFVDGGTEATVEFDATAAAKDTPVKASWNIKTGTKVRMAAGASMQSCDNAPPAGGTERTSDGTARTDLAALTCTVSGDASNPAVSVTVVLPPPSGKATFKEFTVTKKTDTAALARDQAGIAQCLTESGEVSAVAVKASWNLKENVK